MLIGLPYQIYQLTQLLIHGLFRGDGSVIYRPPPRVTSQCVHMDRILCFY